MCFMCDVVEGGGGGVELERIRRCHCGCMFMWGVCGGGVILGGKIE